MKPLLAELFGTEMLSLFGGIAALLIGTGTASPAVFAGLASLVGAAVLFAPVMARMVRRQT
jgi:membrane protein implicated in regulation of membrane protease activity